MPMARKRPIASLALMNSIWTETRSVGVRLWRARCSHSAPETASNLIPHQERMNCLLFPFLMRVENSNSFLRSSSVFKRNERRRRVACEGPSTKIQARGKHQAPMLKSWPYEQRAFEIWSFLWSLDPGACSFFYFYRLTN